MEMLRNKTFNLVSRRIKKIIYMSKEQFEKENPGLKEEMMMEESIASAGLANNSYQKLRDKIIEAVGKKENYSLEDVLVAIEKESGLKIKTIFGTGGYTKDDLISIIENWEPNKPLQDQRDETKELIGNLLT